MNPDAAGLSFKEAVFGKTYGRASWTCFILNFFNQATGVSVICIYLTRMLFNLQEKSQGKFPISPFVGSYIFGTVNLAAATTAIVPSLYYGRKPILLWGQLTMGVCMLLTGYCIVQELYLASFFILMVFVVSFQLS